MRAWYFRYKSPLDYLPIDSLYWKIVECYLTMETPKLDWPLSQGSQTRIPYDNTNCPSIPLEVYVNPTIRFNPN